MCAKDASSGNEGVIVVEVRVLLWWMTKDDDLKLELSLSYPLLKRICLVELLLPLVLKTKLALCK